MRGIRCTHHSLRITRSRTFRIANKGANGDSSVCMTRLQVLDLYFLEARSKLIDLAAFFDRVERADGDDDFRMIAFRSALKELAVPGKDRAKNVLLAFSDPTTVPIDRAPGKGAVGAWSGVK